MKDKDLIDWEEYIVKKDTKEKRIYAIMFIFFTILFTFFIISIGHAEEINIEKLANSIYIAEGGAKTSHPYGILAHYKTTTPRQACINTIKHSLRDWNGKGDFIAFLGSRYCPVGASNDPQGLNKNWIKNVTYYYNQ